MQQTPHVKTRHCPHNHVRRLDERTELWILKHEVRAIRWLACRCDPVIEPREGLLQYAPHTVRADDKICIEYFNSLRRVRDARLIHNDLVWPHVAYGGGRAHRGAKQL